LSSLSNKTILYNEKIFKIIGLLFLSYYLGSSIFIFYEYKPPEGTRAKTENTDKIQAAINQTAGTLNVCFCFRGSPLSLGQKRSLSSSRVGRKCFIIRKLEGIAYENKKLPDSEKQML
jgi:hypothetical protein